MVPILHVVIKDADRALKIGQFYGSHDVLTPMILNLYTIFASNWNFNQLYEAVFLRCKESKSGWERGRYKDRPLIGAVFII